MPASLRSLGLVRGLAAKEPGQASTGTATSWGYLSEVNSQLGGIRQVSRFTEDRLSDSVLGESPISDAHDSPAPRPTPPRFPKLTPAVERELVAVAQSPPPAGRARWTLHLLADRLVHLEVVDSLSYETVRRGLKKTTSRRTARWAG